MASRTALLRVQPLLVLTAGGRQIRLSDTPLSVTDGADTLVFGAGLSEVQRQDVLEIGTEPEDISIDVELQLSEADHRVFANLEPGGWQAELSLWAEGQEFSERRVLAKGAFDNVSYGSWADPVTGVVEERFSDDRGLTPKATWVVNSDTWTPPSDYSGEQPAAGASYPIVVGQPGRALPNDDFGQLYGWPAPAVIFDSNGDNSATACTVLLGAGLLNGIGSASITLINASADPVATYDITPVASKDLLGQTVTTASVTAANLPIAAGDELWASAKSLVGIRDGSGKPLVGAGDVIRWLLQQSSLRIDLASLDESLTQLNLFRLDGVWTEPTSPYRLVIDEILPLLPASLCLTSRGLSLRLWPWQASEKDVQARIGPTYGCFRDSTVDWTSVYELKSAFAFRYGYDLRAGDYRRILKYVPEPSYSDPTENRNPWCIRADSRINPTPGLRAGWRWEELESQLVGDPATARAILDWKARRASTQVRQCRYRCPENFAFLRAGSVVWWEDSEVFVNTLAWVREIVWRPDVTEIVVETLPSLLVS